MLERTVQIMNETGLHARPSALFVKLSSTFPLIKDGFSVNGKSILGVMSLAAEKGSKLIIRTIGDREQEASDSLIELIKGFAEMELSDDNKK
ncbi:HPr family phosphocarrier protein [candidate division KSB1 bacterium]